FHEGQWKAGQFGAIKDFSYYWQAVQQARFADSLQKLGYSIRRTKHAFEIEGVPQSALDKFSKRTKQIEKRAEEIAAKLKLAILPPRLKAALGASTREAKDTSLSLKELVAVWERQLDTAERVNVRSARGEPRQVNYDDRKQVERAIHHA